MPPISEGVVEGVVFIGGALLLLGVLMKLTGCSELVPRVNGYKIETETKAKQRIMKSCEVLAKLEESRIITLDAVS